MALSDDLARIALAAGEGVVGVLAVEVLGARLYLCAFESGEWLALDEAAQPVADLRLVREAASLAALCEVAEESAGGGDLPELRARLAELRESEAPEGIEDAEAAAAALAEVIRQEPRVASGAYLDAIGSASRRLEETLGETGASPFAAAMQSALGAVEELAADVERNYKLSLP